MNPESEFSQGIPTEVSRVDNETVRESVAGLTEEFFPDKTTKEMVIRYSFLYINDYLHNLNIAETEELSQILSRFDDLEELEPGFLLQVGQVETLLYEKFEKKQSK